MCRIASPSTGESLEGTSDVAEDPEQSVSDAAISPDTSAEIARLQQRLSEIEQTNAHLQVIARESAHRYKNHLQMLVMLLDMMLQPGQEEVPASEVKRLTLSVQTLAALHDLLTQGLAQDGQETSVSCKSLLERAMAMLRDITGGRSLGLRLEDLRLPPRAVMALTLIGLELVCNALKHGRSEIQVQFSVQEGDGVLEVGNEVSNQSDVDEEYSPHFGLELVVVLAHTDLRGELTLRKEGARVIAAVRFPIPPLPAVH